MVIVRKITLNSKDAFNISFDDVLFMSFMGIDEKEQEVSRALWKYALDAIFIEWQNKHRVCNISELEVEVKKFQGTISPWVRKSPKGLNVEDILEKIISGEIKLTLKQMEKLKV